MTNCYMYCTFQYLGRTRLLLDGDEIYDKAKPNRDIRLAFYSSALVSPRIWTDNRSLVPDFYTCNIR